jgi:hypothetical protein
LKSKKEDSKQFKEVWVPGFSVENRNSISSQKLAGKPIENKKIVGSVDFGIAKTFCNDPHEGSLTITDISQVFIVTSSFFFGILTYKTCRIDARKTR